MSFIPVDILLRTAFQGALQDLRANDWILRDIFNSLPGDQLSSPEYAKEWVEAIKWTKTQDIPVFLQHRSDLPTFPSIVLVNNGYREMTERAALADVIEPYPEQTSPQPLTTTPTYVYPAFTPKTYDASTGTVTFPAGLNTTLMAPGLFLVSATNQAYVVKKVLNAAQFQVAAGVTDDFTAAYVLPPTNVWNLAKERTFLEHRYSVFAAAQGSPIYALWLNAIVSYVLLRYKEVYFEGRGFVLSTWSAGPLTLDSRFDHEKVFFVETSLTGQVEMNVIKYAAPRLYETYGEIVIADGPRTPSEYRAQVNASNWKMAADVGETEE
jgi:hypothetical protein